MFSNFHATDCARGHVPSHLPGTYAAQL